MERELWKQRANERTAYFIFFIDGRLDAFGAQQLDEWIKGTLQDDDKELVIDLSGSTYLSSGGLRTFSMLKKEMKRRNGRFALASVGEYPKKVLDMAGFSTILEIFPTTDAAVEDMRKKRKNPTLFNEIFYKKIEEGGVSLTIEPGWMTSPPTLRSPVIFQRSFMPGLPKQTSGKISFLRLYTRLALVHLVPLKKRPYHSSAR